MLLPRLNELIDLVRLKSAAAITEAYHVNEICDNHLSEALKTVKTSTTRFKTTRDGASRPESQDGRKSSWRHRLRIHGDVISVKSPRRSHLDDQTLKIPAKFDFIRIFCFSFCLSFISIMVNLIEEARNKRMASFKSLYKDV